MNTQAIIDDLHEALSSTPVDLARAALVIARVEYPHLDPGPTMSALDALGERAARRLEPLAGTSIVTRVTALGRFLYSDEGFAGNRDQYSDFRNSLLNVV